MSDEELIAELRKHAKGTAIGFFEGGRFRTTDLLTHAADALTRSQSRIEELERALRFIRGWDMLDVTADGPFWKRALDEALHDTPKEGS